MLSESREARSQAPLLPRRLTPAGSQSAYLNMPLLDIHCRCTCATCSSKRSMSSLESSPTIILSNAGKEDNALSTTVQSGSELPAISGPSGFRMSKVIASISHSREGDKKSRCL